MSRIYSQASLDRLIAGQPKPEEEVIVAWIGQGLWAIDPDKSIEHLLDLEEGIEYLAQVDGVAILASESEKTPIYPPGVVGNKMALMWGVAHDQGRPIFYSNKGVFNLDGSNWRGIETDVSSMANEGDEWYLSGFDALTVLGPEGPKKKIKNPKRVSISHLTIHQGTPYFTAFKDTKNERFWIGRYARGALERIEDRPSHINGLVHLNGVLYDGGEYGLVRTLDTMPLADRVVKDAIIEDIWTLPKSVAEQIKGWKL